ncbi:MAG: SURF1 family protein [Comamonas sp.]
MTVETSGARKRSRSTFTKAVLALAGIALFISFLSLGTWQVQRRAWKLDLIERIDQRVHTQPVAVPAAADWPQVGKETHEYLPVTAQGRWLEGRSVLTQAVSELGAGFWLLTPLQQADGSQVLVNRGFVPTAERKAFADRIAAAASDASANAAADPVVVTGLLRLSEPKGGFMRENAAGEDRWHSRDVAAIAAAKGLAQAAPFFIDQGLPGQLVAGKVWPRPGMTVIQFSNTHAVYALTWYGLALMVLLAAWLVVRHERRARDAAAQ